MAAVAVSVALLLVAGCGGDASDQSSTNDNGNGDVEQSAQVPESDEESDTPSPDTSSPESSGSTAMPTSKAAVRQELHDATVHFYETVDEASTTGNVSALKELRDPNTASGAFVREILRLQQKDQQSASEVNYTVEDFSIKRHGDDRTVDAFFTLSFDAGAIVDAEGNEVRSFESGSSEKKITFVREGSEWLVNRIADQ